MNATSRAKQLLADYLNLLASSSVIRSYHRDPEGTLQVYIECAYCELIEKFETVEAATAFGIIHRTSLQHLSKLAQANLGHSTRPILQKRPKN